MVEVYQIGALSLGMTIGFLVRIFIRRFENLTPKGFATVIGVLVGGGIIKFLSTPTDAIWYYSIGLLVGVIVIYPILVFTEIKYNLNVMPFAKKTVIDDKTLEMIPSKGGSLKKASLGTVYRRKGDLDKAVEYYKMSLKIDEEIGRKEGIAENYGNLGNVYFEKGDLEKALDYYEKALEIDQEMGRKEGIACTYGNIGSIFSEKGDLDKALDYLEKSLSLAFDGGFFYVIQIGLPLTIDIYNRQNNPEKANELKEKFKEKYPQLDIPTISE